MPRFQGSGGRRSGSGSELRGFVAGPPLLPALRDSVPKKKQSLPYEFSRQHGLLYSLPEGQPHRRSTHLFSICGHCYCKAYHSHQACSLIRSLERA